MAWAVAAALAAALAGCGDDNKAPRLGASYPIKGKVTLPDGKPLPGVRLVFSGPATAVVTTGGDGTFASQGDEGGLPAGDYKVRIEVGETRGVTRKSGLPFPGKYLDEDTTDLTAKVTPSGPNDFDLKMSRGDGAAGKPSVARGVAAKFAK